MTGASAPRPERVLAVSPHLDDAALSVGASLAQLARGGTAVEVVTPFAGRPGDDLSELARRTHERGGYPLDGSAVARRCDEDRAALAALGAVARHGDLADALYRTTDDGSWVCRRREDLFSPALPPERALEDELLAYLDRIRGRFRPTLLLTCAAIGGHVDHRLTRAAVARLARRHAIETVLWEDLPYAIGTELATPPEGLQAAPWAVDEVSWARKWESLAAYEPQLRIIWGEGDWRRDLEEHALARGSGARVELLWRLRP